MESTTSVGLVPTTDELLANFRILVAWRELTGLGMVLLAAASSHAPASAFRPVPLLLLGFTQIIWNFFMWLIATRAARHVVPAAYAQALVDLAIFGLIFHFTGGIESPLNVYLMIHLFGTGLLLSKYASIGVTILAVALMAAIRATASLAVNSADLRSRTLAQWSAENRLAQIRIAHEWPNLGRRQYDCSQANVALLCREDVIQTPNPLFRRVEVSVFGEDGTFRLARLVGFSTRLP
jgi:general secretion pathway protein I